MSKLFFILIVSLGLYFSKDMFKSTLPQYNSTTYYIKSKQKLISPDDPPCYQMYYYIEKYSREYHIPKIYLYGIAYYETRYKGPLDYSYNHLQESNMGAVGPMQVMIHTANYINPNKTNRQELKSNIKLNVRTSARLLNHLYKRYKDWKTVFGCYNTGRPMVNDYARNVYKFNLKLWRK